jgi:ATP/maltotriose-dependent transcriptional regulator MalT
VLHRFEWDDVGVSTVPAETALAEGYEALATGAWTAARDAFTDLLARSDVPDALDGLGRALWWLGDERGAIVNRERAYAGFRRDGDLARAARIALWLSREYALAYGNDAASRGWLARAERLLRDVAPSADRGWLDLARSERTADSSESAALAGAALEVGLTSGDADLELRALAQLGLAEVALGHVDSGLGRLDEAMAAAMSGEPATLETFADVACSLMLACDLAGDSQRQQQWGAVFEDFVRKYDHVTLLAFCRTCCADVYAADGRIDAAEKELLTAIRELTEADQRSRCLHPAVRLAEIRIMQGRFDEAERLLSGFDDDPDAVAAAVSLRLARGDAEAAEELLVRRLDEIGGSNLLAAPLLGQLVEARLARDHVDQAGEAAVQLAKLADGSGRERMAALGDLAHARVAARRGDIAAADLFRQALNAFAALGLRLETARTRLELAQVLAEISPGAAADVAHRSRDELDALGATREAAMAAALMRSLGVAGRTGPKGLGLLSKRETEVLRLVSEGLSNKQIAARLFISPKTAEHHLGRIYEKLGVKARSEAAAYAIRHLGP